MSFWARGYFVSTVGAGDKGCSGLYQSAGKGRASSQTTIAVQG